MLLVQIPVAIMIGRSTLRLLALAALLAVLLPVVGRAQHWKTLYPASLGGSACLYFINIDTGFLYDHERVVDPMNDASCYRTSNAGVDWYPVDAFDQMRYTIRQMWFATRERGYAIVDTAYGTGFTKQCGFLYESTDAGVTWNRISPDWMNAHSVYATGKTIFVTATANGFIQTFGQEAGTFPFPDTGAIYRSTDLGVTWDSMAAGPQLPPSTGLLLSEIVGNRDSLVCVLAADITTQTYFIHSEDLGNTWHTETLEKLNMGRDYELQAYCLPYSCSVIRVLDDTHEASIDRFGFLEGMPPFAASSWHQVLDAETGGWVSGTPCAQYISDASSDNGFLRLMNGVTASVGGPDMTEVDDADFRNVAVVGHGAVVYAPSFRDPVRRTVIERTMDGGDGKLTVAALAPKIRYTLSSIGTSETADTVLVCDTGTIILTDQNMACSIAKLDSVTVSGLDPSAYTLSTHRYNVCSGLPDTTFIGIRRGSPYSGQFTIGAHFTDDDLNAVDTSFVRTLVRRTARLAFFFSLPNNTLNAHASDTISVPVTVAVDPDAPVTLSGMTHLTLFAKYNRDLLTHDGFRPFITGVTSDSGTLATNALEYQLTASNGFSVKTGDTLGIMRFSVRLADSLHSDLDFSVGAMSSDDPRCIMTSATSVPIDVTVSELCGDQLLRDFMMTHNIAVSIQSVVPNPASDHLHVQYANATSDDVGYRLFDALGAVRQSGSLAHEASTLELNVAEVPAGIYQIELSLPSGARAARQIAITR